MTLQGLIASALLGPWSWRVKGRTERTGAQWFGFFLCHAHQCPFPGEKPERLLNWGNKTLCDCFVLLLSLLLYYLFTFPLSFSSSTYLLFPFDGFLLCAVPLYSLLSSLKTFLTSYSVTAVVSTQSTVAPITLMGFLLSGPLLRHGISLMEPPGA